MTQKIFYANGKKDKDSLWSILPDSTQKIVRGDGQTLLFNSDGECFATIESFVLKINWQDKREITRPVNYEDMIGCVGWFWDDRENCLLGRLEEYYNGDDFPFSNGDNCYKNFRPAKKSELKFWGEEAKNKRDDCQTLAQKLLQVKPELREWLEVNYKEYL